MECRTASFLPSTQDTHLTASSTNEMQSPTELENTVSETSTPESPRDTPSESEDIKSDLSIEEYIYRRDPYRSTTIKEPWPYPIMCNPAPLEITERVEACRDEILQILSDHDFPERCYLRLSVSEISKPEYPNGDQPITVLHLGYVPDTPALENLDPATNAVHRLLRRKGIQEMHVEIVSIDKCFRPSQFPISSDDPAVAAYSSAKGNIMQYIDAVLRDRWHLIFLVNVGLYETTSVPSIVIFVDPYTLANWWELGLQVQWLLPGGHSNGISVEFIPGEIAISTPGHEGFDMSHTIRDDGTPLPGTSIGVRPGAAGTLGPFVTLSYQGKTWNGALTTF